MLCIWKTYTITNVFITFIKPYTYYKVTTILTSYIIELLYKYLQLIGDASHNC